MANGWQRDLGVQFLMAVHETVTVTWAQALCLLQSQDSVSDAHRVSHGGVEILAWEIEILSWHCQLLGTAAQSLSETLLAAALLKGTSFPGRVLAESLAGEPVPLRSINASKGHQRSIAASRNISPRERCQPSAGTPALAGSVRDSDPYECHQPLCELSVPGRAVGPWGVGPSRGVALAEDSGRGSMQIAARAQSMDVTSSRRRSRGQNEGASV